jgi:Glycosidases
MKTRTFFFLFALAASVVLLSCGDKTKADAMEVQVFTATPEWAENAVIYELNTRQFTPEGTLNAAALQLPRLKALGVDIVWLMPIYPIGVVDRKGTLGSYYAIKDYTEVNPEFGTLADFDAFVKKAHDLGLYVILDWVANHTSPDHAWITEHPDYYKLNDDGLMFGPFEWTDVRQLNYDNQDLWKAMISEMMFWVNDYNIDGFRCDVAGMVPVGFWEAAVAKLDSVKPIFMLAEDENVVALSDKAFDANYGWEFHSIMNSIAKGEKNVNDIWTYFAKNDTLFSKSFYRMYFTSNHDENSWNGTEFERMGDGAKAFAVLTYTVPGIPLIYNGQEVGLSRRLDFFEKDSIDWNEAPEFTSFYQTLNRIKKENPALANADNGGTFEMIETDYPEQVLAFTRAKDADKLLVLINLSNNDLNVNVPFNQSFQDLMSGQTVQINDSLNMPAWSYFILK